MTRDELGHLEHAHLALAIEDRAQVFIGVDLCALLFVLQTVLFDIIPELLREFRARE